MLCRILLNIIFISDRHESKQVLTCDYTRYSAILFVDDRHVAKVHQPELIEALLQRIVLTHRERPRHHKGSDVNLLGPVLEVDRGVLFIVDIVNR